VLIDMYLTPTLDFAVNVRDLVRSRLSGKVQSVYFVYPVIASYYYRFYTPLIETLTIVFREHVPVSGNIVYLKGEIKERGNVSIAILKLPSNKTGNELVLLNYTVLLPSPVILKTREAQEKLYLELERIVNNTVAQYCLEEQNRTACRRLNTTLAILYTPLVENKGVIRQVIMYMLFKLKLANTTGYLSVALNVSRILTMSGIAMPCTGIQLVVFADRLHRRILNATIALPE